jgi:RNA polymerase sigma factor (sigma-70 family)
MAGVLPSTKILTLADGARSKAAARGPLELTRLLDAPDEAHANRAWDAFLSAFGHLLLKTAHYTHRDHDGAMDAYAHVLERLRQEKFRRLRTFSGDDTDALSRWLVVVARRMCLDFRRERYGRPRPSVPELERDTRRRLVDELWDPREPSELPSPNTSNPEWQLRRTQQRRALESAVGALAPRDQLLLSLRFDDELSARQIAQVMGWPTPFHVYRRLNKLLPELRERLRTFGIEDPNP